jgi:energy-coupling factor transporter transmembrane protein EcfT
MSEEVYQAMLARGFNEEVRTLTEYRLRALDVALLITALLIAILALYAGRTWV